MSKIEITGPYSDDRGNKIIVGENTNFTNSTVNFKGENNIVIISDKNNNIRDLTITFYGSESIFIKGKTEGRAQTRGVFRLGFGSLIAISDFVTCTNPILMSCSEGTQILLGEDCMFATNNHIRTEDAHLIFNALTGDRVNTSQDIIIGAHVWLSYAAKVYRGSIIGDGSIVGLNSIVKGHFPNNCTISGSPAKIIRKNVAWDRTNPRSLKSKITHASELKKHTPYWRETDAITVVSKTPQMGSSLTKLFNILKKHKPKSIWLEKNKILLSLQKQ